MNDIPSSEITAERLFRSRRQFLRSAAALIGGAALLSACGTEAPPAASSQPGDATSAAGQVKGATDELGDKLTDYDSVVGYNNYYEVTTEKEGVADLAKNFKTVTMQGMLECAGSGRSGYKPTASGTPWLETGGMGCPTWGGVRLSDLLKAAGVKPGAVHVSGQGGDPGMVPSAAPVIRSIPMKKAMDDSTLVAWAMNGQPLPWVHGYPLRLVVPGWVGSASTKWLHTLTVLDAPFKGTYMDSSYRVPPRPIEPGTKMPPDAVSAEAWPIKSMITSPAPNAKVKGPVTVRGHAWVGDGAVDRVEISSDEGKTWQRAQLAPLQSLHPRAWRTFTYEHKPQNPGYVTFLARAWDSAGNAQPAVPAWNPLGYFWNGWHRVGVLVEA